MNLTIAFTGQFHQMGIYFFCYQLIMPEIMKRVLLSTFIIWMSVIANAQCAHTKDTNNVNHVSDIKIDNVYYQFISDSTVRVTAYNTDMSN